MVLLWVQLTVHLIIAQDPSQMLMESHFVMSIKQSFEITVMFTIAKIIELTILRLVRNTVMSGTDIHSQEQNQA